MDILDAIKEKAASLAPVEESLKDPDGAEWTWISQPEAARLKKIRELTLWYAGDGDALLDFYTTQTLAGGFASEPIHWRNKRNYFWGISPSEGDIKRVHSGLPKAIVDTLAAIVGSPNLPREISDDALMNEITKKQMPLTMVGGYGAYKMVMPKGAERPIARFYDAENVHFVRSQGKDVGVIFSDWYKTRDGRTHLVLETRRLTEDGTCVEYDAFSQSEDKSLTHESMNSIPGLEGLRPLEIKGYKHLLAVPCRFLYDAMNPDYGRSIYDGKIDLFDDLDQSLSQRSQTSRVSTPVEYYSPDVLERTPGGMPRAPKVYNRQFIMKSGVPDANGRLDSSIQTTQPMLNFEQYDGEQKSIVNMCLVGLLSPASLGIDLSKRDNAEAQREKEKMTIMTRNAITQAETAILKDLCRLYLDCAEFMATGRFPSQEREEPKVSFNEFANPSFESMSQALLPMWAAGAISDELFVEKLYGISLTAEQKRREIEALRRARGNDMLSLGDYDQAQNDPRGMTRIADAISKLS